MNIKRVLGLSSSAALILCAFAVSATASIIDDTSLAAPGFYNGSGNSNSNFTVATGDGIELGLSAILRYVGPVDPGAGSNTYIVPTGIGGGVALWDFEFSINVDGGGNGSALSDYTYAMQIADTTTSVVSPFFDPTTTFDDNAEWNGARVYKADLTTVSGAQNAENLSWLGGPFDPNATDDYTVTLTVTDAANSTSVTDSINIDATAPEPGTILLSLTGIACLPLLRRRFSK